MKGRVHSENFENELSIKLIFKRPHPEKKLSGEESRLLHAYIGEILGEVEVEHKRIIEEERLAALEVTGHHQKQED